MGSCKLASLVQVFTSEAAVASLMAPLNLPVTFLSLVLPAAELEAAKKREDEDNESASYRT